MMTDRFFFSFFSFIFEFQILNCSGKSLFFSPQSTGMSPVEKRTYTSTSTPTLSASTTIATGKGMYVTCSSRGILDQGNVVRGTYFPPLATTQDHQNLGTVTPSQTVSATSMSNYTTNHHLDSQGNNGGGGGGPLHLNSTTTRINSSQSQPSNNIEPALMSKNSNNSLIESETSIVSSQNGLIDGYGNYESITVTAPMPTYATSSFTSQYKDYYHQNQSPVSNASGTPNIHSQHMVDEVDSREFEKYFKYPGKTS